MELNVHLEAFEGPLDLLLHLIDKNKVNIYDIPIASITDQYIEYVHAMENQDLDVMSEFLIMASTLLDIKSRMLLPREKNEEGEEIDPRAELVEQLLEYKMYRCISQELYDLQDNADQVLFKGPTIPEEIKQIEEPVDVEELTKDLTLQKLGQIFTQVMQRQEGRVDPIRSRFGTIEREQISLDDRIVEVRDIVLREKKTSFRRLLSGQHSKLDVIVTFLSVLERMKSGLITTYQENTFDDIIITAKDVEQTGE